MCYNIVALYTVQLTSKLTLACDENVCVFQFLSCHKSKHTCNMKWAACKSTFVHCTRAIFVRCMQVIIRVMHNSKKHPSNASFVVRESVFLCAACKLTAVFCQRRIKAYNEKAHSKSDKRRRHKENNTLSSIYVPLL